MPKINTKTPNKKFNTNNHISDLERVMLEKIRSGQIEMKPKWFFAVGSFFMAVGFACLTVSAVFLTNLTVFLIRKRGPGYGRLEMMLSNFPWWIPVLAVFGIVLGVLLLKKYDFSYKKNFPLMILGFIISVVIAAFTIDYLGLNDRWSHGPMRKFYQQFEHQNTTFPNGQGPGMLQK